LIQMAEYFRKISSCHFNSFNNSPDFFTQFLERTFFSRNEPVSKNTFNFNQHFITIHARRRVTRLTHTDFLFFNFCMKKR